MLQTNPAALQNGSGGDEGKAAAAEGEAADGAQPPAKKAKTEVGFAFQSQCPFLVTAFWRLPTIEITDTFSTQLCWAQSLTVCSYGTCESPNVAVHSEGRRVFLCCVPTLEVQIWRRGQRRRGGNACRGAIQRRCASWTPSWVAAACARSGEAAVVPEKTRIVRKSTEVAVHAPMTCEDRLSVCAGGEAPEFPYTPQILLVSMAPAICCVLSPRYRCLITASFTEVMGNLGSLGSLESPRQSVDNKDTGAVVYNSATRPSALNRAFPSNVRFPSFFFLFLAKS